MTGAVRRERMVRHGFVERPARTVAAAVALTTAVQAQDHPAARLGVRARSVGLDEADVVHAVAETRTVVRTWLMRGTIHLVDVSDLRWLVALFGPALQRKFATRWRQIGLTQPFVDRCVALLPQVLRTGPRTRAEIVADLEGAGLRFTFDDPQAAYHVLLYASSLGIVCRGADRRRTATFALIDQWVPDAPAGPRGDDALAELTRRYFQAFSPATAADFTTWSGLAGGPALSLIRDELTPADVHGRPGFRLGAVEPAGGVRLLPAYDNYLIGYRERAFIEDGHRGRVYEGGVIRASVLVDGRIAGLWRVDRDRLVVTPFETYSARTRRAVESEAADVARFLGRPLQLAFDQSA
jgi:hypothetical protein